METMYYIGLDVPCYPNDKVARVVGISFPIDILYVARYCPIDSR
jgi:hypothetical protein